MNNFSEIFKELGPVKLSMMAGVALVILGSIIALSMRLTTPAMSPLFSNLDSKDTTAIITKLDTMSVIYEVRNNGTQIFVPTERVLNIRATLAEEGIPGSGSIVGYEIFDNSNTLGTSNFVNNVNLIRALEGELARTISAFQAVHSARVHLVIPKRDLFSRTKQEPSASVVLKLRSAGGLGKTEIHAISHLVATAVPGLDLKKITIVDTNGTPLKFGANNEDDPAIFASNNESFKASFENRMKRTIEELIGHSVGVGRVAAEIHADIDFDRVVINSELYDPEGRVERSRQSTSEKELSSEPKSGNITVENNLPNNNADLNSGSQSSVERTDEVINYEISKTVKNQISETGNIKRLSIAVLVDGLYEEDEETGEIIYTPRSTEELRKYEDLIKSSVGFDSERGDSISVLNLQFSRELTIGTEPSSFDWVKRDFGKIIQTTIIGIVVILLIILVIRPMLNKVFDFSQHHDEEIQLQQALEGGDFTENYEEDVQKSNIDSIIDLEKLEERMNSSSVNAINDIVERHPEETLSIIRNWIERG